MKVAYAGDPQHSGYGFSKEDFERAELEGEDIFFPLNEAVEVSDEVGKALVGKSGLLGDIPFVEVTDEGVEEGEVDRRAAAASKRAAKKAASSGDPSGTPTSGGAAMTQGTSTSAGTSTPGSST